MEALGTLITRYTMKAKRPRFTKQKSIIMEVLQSSSRPLSASVIHAKARVKAPSINKTTVYRTLSRLAADSEILVILLREGEMHYELPRGTAQNGVHHHHFICVDCDKIYCIEGGCSSFKELLPRGFLIQSHELTLRGLCKECG